MQVREFEQAALGRIMDACTSIEALAREHFEAVSGPASDRSSTVEEGQFYSATNGIRGLAHQLMGLSEGHTTEANTE